MSQRGIPSRGNNLAMQQGGGLLNGYFDEVSWTQVMAWSDVTFLLSAATWDNYSCSRVRCRVHGHRECL